MAYRKLNLDRDKINQCRETAARIVKPVQKYIDRHSSLSIESSVLVFFGIEYANDRRPLADLVITKLDRNRMRRGISYWFGRALAHTRLPARVLAGKIADGRISFENIPEIPSDKIREAVSKLTAEGFGKIDDAINARKTYSARFENVRQTPLILASPENTHELATFVSDEDTDIILIKNIKRTSLPFEEMRKKSARLKRFAAAISGLEGPKQTIYALFAGADFVSKDTLKEILIEGINPKRAFVDAHWARRLGARAQVSLISEGAHIRELDAYREAHEVLVSQFIEEQLGEKAGVTPELFAVGHAYDIAPSMEDGFLHELARADLMREVYPRNTVVFLPPKNPTPLFYLAGAITEQSIIVIGAEKNKLDAIKEAGRILKNTRTLGDEIQFNPNGKIARRANTILENAFRDLRKIEHAGLLESLAKGSIAAKTVDEKGGLGLEGVFQKERDYFNPIEEFLSCEASPEPIIRPAREHRFHRGRKHGRYRHRHKPVFKKPS